jgi:hypothetical protein
VIAAIVAFLLALWLKAQGLSEWMTAAASGAAGSVSALALIA